MNMKNDLKLSFITQLILKVSSPTSRQNIKNKIFIILPGLSYIYMFNRSYYEN